MRVDPILVALLAGARLVPIAALAAYLRGARAVPIALLAIVAWGFAVATGVRGHRVAQRVRREAATDAANAIARRAPDRMRGGAHDEYLVRVLRAVIARGRLSTEIEPTLVATAVAALFAFAVILAVDGPAVPLVSFVALVLVLVVRWPLHRRLTARLGPLHAATRKLARDLGSGLRALDDLHAHGLAPAFARRVRDTALELEAIESEVASASRLASWTPLLAGGLVALAAFARDLVGPREQLLTRVAMLATLGPMAFAFARSVVERARLRGEARALEALVELPEDLPSSTANVAAPSSLVPIALESVTHRPPPPFESNEPPATEVFEDVSLRWGGARPLALVGPNGSGKTTLLSLIVRLADPTHGRVTVNGVDLRTVDPATFRPRVAYVAQRPMLLEGMRVRDAIHLVAPGVDDARIRDALGKVGLLARLERRGDPLDVPCSTLSVGEAQRVAIARALVRDPELLVLDEPEAGLDAAARASLRTLLEELSRRGTHVAVAAQNADVFPEGASVLELPLPKSARVERP